MKEKAINIIKGGVTSAKGFLAEAVAAGLKKNDLLDLALIYSEVPASVAGVYTTNPVKAAPLELTKQRVSGVIGQQSLFMPAMPIPPRRE